MNVICFLLPITFIHIKVMILHEQFYNVSKVAYHFSLSCCADNEVFTADNEVFGFILGLAGSVMNSCLGHNMY